MVVESKYGSAWSGWCSNEVLRLYGVGLWKNIKRAGGEFSSYTRFEVDDDSKIRSWHDV